MTGHAFRRLAGALRVVEDAMRGFGDVGRAIEQRLDRAADLFDTGRLASRPFFLSLHQLIKLRRGAANLSAASVVCPSRCAGFQPCD